MIEIRTLTELGADDLRRLFTGYTSAERYRVQRSESEHLISFTLELVPLDTPYVAQAEPPDDEDMQEYLDASKHGRSLGVYEGDVLIAIALAYAQTWSNRLWLWEFRVAESHQGIGVGTQLMEALIEQARQAGFRGLFLETQNTNAPAMRFYRKMGFTVEGLHLSIGSNHDYPDGEIAVFMMRKLQD